MDYIFIVKIFLILFSIFMLGERITSYLNLLHEKEISQYGYTIQGKIEKIRFNPFSDSMTRRHYDTPVVSFTWRDAHYQLKTLTTVPHQKYHIGANIEVQYLPEYPRKIIVKEEKLSSGIGFLWDTIIIVVCVVGAIYSVIKMS